MLTIEPGTTGMGTLYIAAHYGSDRVSVRLEKSGDASDAKQLILSQTLLLGNVPIYLQQLHLGSGDSIWISSQTGDSSFVFTGEQYS